MTLYILLSKLHSLANPKNIQFKKEKFGIVSKNALGIYLRDINVLAKEIGLNNELALQLYDTGIYEAKILCSKLFNPKDLTEALADKWVQDFDNWEICDSFCMSVIGKSPLAVKKALEWTARSPEFEKRAGFTVMATYCMADKKASNELYKEFLPILKREAKDDRIYVKKAVNWALRSIGKRNIDLNKAAITVAKEIQNIDNKSAKWIAQDALRELQNDKVKILDYPRAIYRK